MREPGDFKIVAHNVNGLKGAVRKGEFWKFLRRQQADTVCLSEIKLNMEGLAKVKGLAAGLRAFGYFYC